MLLFRQIYYFQLIIHICSSQLVNWTRLLCYWTQMLCDKVLAHWVRTFCMRISGIVCIRHPFLSKCLLPMRKRRKSNLIQKFVYDGRKFWRQCVNMIYTTWGRIYFFNVQKFGRKCWTLCAMTFSKCKKKLYIFFSFDSQKVQLIT